MGGRCEAYARFLSEQGSEELEDHEALSEFGERGYQTCDARPSKVTYEQSQEGWAAARSIDFMRDAVERGKPFILHTSLPKPHQCHAPAQEFWDMYDEADLVLPPNVDYDMARKAPHLRRAAEQWRGGEWTLFEPRTFEDGRLRKLHGYLGCVSHVDHAVGQMLQWLDNHGPADNTVVIYTSDHGDYVCQHDIMEKAPGICSDAITRVPCIWRLPGRIAAGHVAEELVQTVDIAPTLCSLAGIEALETADGKDVSPLLCGRRGAIRDLAVSELVWSKNVRKGKWMLVYYPREMFAAEYPDGFGELYDLQAGPWEMENLYFNADHADVVAELERDLLDWMITTTRPGTVLPVNSCVPLELKQALRRYDCTVNYDGKIDPDHIRRASTNNYI